MFGKSGLSGWAMAFLGAILTTLLGCAIAGTAIMPVLGTMIAPLAVAVNIATAPGVLFIWLAGMAAMHLCLRKSTD